MPFSDLKYKDTFLEIRDSRLEDIIDLCVRFLPEFVQEYEPPNRIIWLEDTVKEWAEQRELPPGCKLIRLDDLLSLPERSDALLHFFAFVANKVRNVLPSTDR